MALCILLTSPGTIGAQAHRAAVLTPPYAGWEILQNVHNVDRCGKGSAHSRIATPVFFDLSSGAGGMSGTGSAQSCRNGQTSTGYTDQYLTAYLTIPHRAGLPTVYVNGSFALSGNLSFTTGRCIPTPGAPYGWCDQLAYIGAGISADFTDLTASSPRQFYMGGVSLYNYSGRSESCNLGNCTTYSSGPNSTIGIFSLSGSFSFAYTLASAMVRSGSYAVVLRSYGEAGGSCSVQFFRDVGCAGAATLNFGTRGHGFTVASITVT